jgi:hypothetical protein
MTNVQTDHPSGLPYIELTEEGRQISFRRDCFGEIKIYRQINDGASELLIERIRTPYVDTDNFPEGTKLSYTIELEQNNVQKQYTLEARL